MSKKSGFLIFILALGTFSILNTELGIIGILPDIAEHYQISVSKAGLLVSLFALVVAVSGPTMPLLFSGINRKKVMLLVLGIFLAGNLISVFTTNFTVLLIARIIPAFFHPVYCSLAFTVAAASVSPKAAPKAVSKVFMGVSAGMVLGVPISSYIASAVSLQMAMVFFASVTAVVFLATILFVPSIPVKERLSYGTQLKALKKPIIWLSAAGVIFMNGAVFGVYSYLAEYLKTVTILSAGAISTTLLLYGVANMVGNMIAGRELGKNPIPFITLCLSLLGAVYAVLFFTGQFAVPMILLSIIWGILAGAEGNFNQYWITSAAPEIPDLANGVFLTSANLGTTFATAICGLFISGMGIQYVVFGGLLFLIFSAAAIFIRKRMA